MIVSTSATTSALVASERNVSTTRREWLSCYILLRKRRVTLVGSRLLSTNMGLVSHLHPRPSRDTRRRSASVCTFVATLWASMITDVGFSAEE